MATFPSYVKLGWRDTAEQHTPVIARSEMERGIARQRRIAADSLVTVPVTAYFDTAAESLAFESWFFSDAAAGAAWFDFTLPRTGALVQARLVGGDIGKLKPSTKNWAFSERSFQIEYIRPSFIQLPPGLHSVDSSRILSVQRASTATYIDGSGLLQTAAANAARYEGGQLLVEAAATNLCQRSSDFGNSYWTNDSTVTFVTGQSDPAGGTSAVKLVEVAAVSAHTVYRTALGVAGPATASVFAKAAERSWVRLSIGGVGAYFNLAAGLVGSVESGVQAAIVALGSGWYRISVSRTVSSPSSIAIRVATTNGTDTYLGVAGSGVIIFGAQHEQGSSLTSHIPTTTAAVTRAADIITVAA